MANQLLATFYVETPDSLFEAVSVTAQIQYQSGSNWYQVSSSELTAVVSPANYNDPTNDNQLRYRYKINLFRVEQSGGYFPLYKAGTYKRRLQVTFNNSFTLERMIYITIQPNLHIYVEDGNKQIDLIHTEEAVVSQNPLVKTLTVKKNESSEALAARTLALVQPNAYKSTVFVKSNLPVDLVSDDLTEDVTKNYQWLRLKDKIITTRKIKNTEYQWYASND
ncbi:MAG: hypothetical protein FWE95_11525 [Planctomycetaceae bacterium]|nr:hypothetical protein [Planctomycetaceae bacterium]